MFNNSKQPFSSTSGWQKTLQLINQCPICGQNYDTKATRLFLDKQAIHLVHITCGYCQSYFLAIVMELGRGISTIGVVTDLSFADIKRLHNQGSITIDEAIEGYEFIEQNDFCKLLNFVWDINYQPKNGNKKGRKRAS